MMKLACPNCGSDACVVAAEEVIAQASSLYAKCADCQDLVLDKQSKIDVSDIPFEDFICSSCGKRPLDAVMGHILSIAESDTKRATLSLREVGTPLLSPSVPLYASPHLSDRSVVLRTSTQVLARAADQILQRVPEVKGILYGDASRTIGLTHTQNESYTCRLLAGCDLRADLVTSAYGQLLIYKSQSKIHIEHDNRVKMYKLGNIPLAGSIVFDALAGPGTLGLMSVLMGAKRVILNDAWLPAVNNAYLNVRVNKQILGLRTIKRVSKDNHKSGRIPSLFCTAHGDSTELELYHGDFEQFCDRDFNADVVLVDPFPGIEYRFMHAVRKLKQKNPAIRAICV